jgi:hypothetical protein
MSRAARAARLVLAVPVLLGACGLASRARAVAPAPLVLDWQGPDDCQEAPRVTTEVQRLLGGESSASKLAARASVERTGRRWHLLLRMERAGHATVRELDAESCGAAADAAALILALTIDPSRALGDEGVADGGREPPTRPPPESGGGEGDAGVLVLPEGGTLSPSADSGGGGLGGFLIAVAATDTGTLPRTAFGVGGGLGFALAPFRVEATLAYWPAVSAEVATTPSRGGSFSMLVTELHGCALAEVSFLSFGGCGGLGFTSMKAEAFGVTTPISAGATWSSFVADALVVGRLSRLFSLRVNAGLTVPFARPTFEIAGLGLVHQPAAVALGLGGGVEAHF